MERDLPIPSTDAGASRRWTILFVALLAQTCAAMPLQGFPALAYFLQQDLEPGAILSRAQIGTLVMVTALTSASGAMASGALADVFGVRRLLLIGQALIGTSFISLGFAPSYSWALLILPLAGAGMSMIVPSLSKVVMYWFTARLRATAMSIKQTGVPLGGALGAATLPSLAVAFGWRVAVVVLGLGVVTAGIVCLFLYREHPDAKAPLNVPRPSVVHGLRQVFRNKIIMLLTLAALPMVSVQYTVVTYFVLYLHDTLEIPVVQAGVLLSLVQLGSIGARLVWGTLSDRFFPTNRHRTLIGIIALGAVTFMMTASLPLGLAVWQVAVAAGLLGATALAWQGVYATHLAEVAGKELSGTATGVNMAIVQAGATAGPPLFGYLVDQTSSYRLAWMLMALCCVISASILFAMRHQRPART